MSKNAPCPFCGNPVKIHYYARDKSFRAFHMNPVEAAHCAVKEPFIIQRPNMSKARAAWNRARAVRELEFTRAFIREHGLEFALAAAWSGKGGEG